MSQSTLSRHLAALEAELGAALVTRESSGIQLTDAGRSTLEVALDIASLTASVKRHYESARQGQGESRLRVGMLVDSSLARSLVERVCSALSQQGGASVMARFLRLRTSGDANQSLRRREVDALVCFAPVKSDGEQHSSSSTARDTGVRQVFLTQVACVVALDAHHELAN